MDSSSAATAEAVSDQITRDKILSEVRGLLHQANSAAQAASGATPEDVQEAHTRIVDLLQKATESFANIESVGKTSFKAATRKVDATVRAHPYETIALAFGVGVLLGALWRRK